MARFIVGIFVCCASPTLRGEESEKTAIQDYARPIQVGNIANDEIDESSGLAESRIQPGIFWTHNDSGDQPRLFAFNRQGADLGDFPVSGIEAVDWEDMSSVSLNGHSTLLIADTGNNQLERKVLTLYLVAEPHVGRDRSARCLQTVRFYYEDGKHNCEAVAYDADSRSVLLATKRLTNCNIYALAWPDRLDTKIQRARKVSTITIPLATGMDISRDGLRLIIATYITGYEFRRHPGENWQEAFSRQPSVVRMPPRLQGESVCYGAGGTSLFLTSEKRPTPLFEIRRLRQGQD